MKALHIFSLHIFFSELFLWPSGPSSSKLMV